MGFGPQIQPMYSKYIVVDLKYTQRVTMKILFAAALISIGLFAEDFDSFLSSAIKNSPYLKAVNLQIEQTTQEGSTLTRYENPDLELEASYFSPDLGDGEIGYRAAYAQPVRLWGVGNNKEALASANVALAEANYAQSRAAFVRDISLQYTMYAQSDLFKALAKEELLLAQTIYEISKERYAAGTTSRGIMLQAQVDYKMVLARVQTLELVSKREYYALLKNAGVTQEVALESDYSFEYKGDGKNNPELLQLENSQKSALANAEVNSNKVEWMSLIGEYEKEPDQDIFRFGASIPLAFFNTKSQERQIATLEASRSEMLTENVKNQVKIEQKRLHYEAEGLKKLLDIDTDILVDEQELLTMYEEGYKIANVNLLALQDVKARLIETKERLIKIKIELDRNAIIQNYLQGNYND